MRWAAKKKKKISGRLPLLVTDRLLPGRGFSVLVAKSVIKKILYNILNYVEGRNILHIILRKFLPFFTTPPKKIIAIPCRCDCELTPQK